MKAPAVPYSIARAELIAAQIARFATQHLHQLAGHHANLTFWLAEAVSALQAIDGSQARFKQLRDAQVSWVREHETKIAILGVGLGATVLNAIHYVDDPPAYRPSLMTIVIHGAATAPSLAALTLVVTRWRRLPASPARRNFPLS